MILEGLAERYPQLYLIPKEGMEEEYRRVVLRGGIPFSRSLELFQGSLEDRFFEEETASGKVEILYLYNREDFNNFLRIMCYRCEPVSIPLTTGAMTLDGVINWKKIKDHQTSYMEKGGTDWPAEMKRFTSVKKNYKDTIIVISAGPYSHVLAEQAGYSEQEWLEISRTIRMYHECTHVICKRLYPQKKDAVWDEAVADAIGLLYAIGRYDIRLAEMFLGISEEGYHGGRLENYVPKEQLGDLDRLAKKLHLLILWISKVCDEKNGLSIYEKLVFMQENKDEHYTA